MKGMFKKKKAVNEEMSLQITSMADIFTLILVFLLKSSGSGISSISPSSGVNLPVSDGSEILEDVLKVELSRDAISVDQKQVVNLKNYGFPMGEIELDAARRSLYQELLAQRKRRPSPNFDSSLLVLADEKIPYGTLKPVLFSAGSAGFVDLQLVVVQNQ